MVDVLYENWLPIWESFLGTVEPHLPEHLHWNELCWTFVIYLNEVRLLIHDKTRGLENWEIVVNTITYCFYAFLIFELLRRVVPFVFCNDKGFFNMMKKLAFKTARKLPIIGDKIQAEVDKSIKEIEETAFTTKGQAYVKKLPYAGMTPNEVKSTIQEKYKSIGNDEWNEGFVSGTVYQANQELSDLMVDVYSQFVWSNPLHFDVFPDVRKMEAEVVQMTINLYNGDSRACGAMTTGGTESIMLACKCYQELGRERGIAIPEIIAPYSVHPAFDKAAHFFGFKITHVPVDKVTGRADIKATKKAISRRTILLVGSCPSYPHGCIDPMEDLAKLARKYNLYLHADCCLGGYLIPFMKKAGYEVPLFDFRIPEVTSISVDTHKYGFTPKGSSVIMYRNKDLRKHQYFTQPNWSGGIYASASLPGSRAGNTIATTWAALMYHGEKGYIETTRKVIECTRYMHEKIAAIPGIQIMAPVDVSVIAFTSDYFDIFMMSTELGERHWHLNPLQFPSGLHIAVTMQHTKQGVADRFVKDVREVASKLMKLPPGQKAEGKGAIYGLSQQIPDRSIITDITTAFLDTYYSCTAGFKSVK